MVCGGKSIQPADGINTERSGAAENAAGKMKVKWKGKTEFLMLTYDKVYEVISIERGWYRINDDSGDDYLYPPEYFEIIDEE